MIDIIVNKYSKQTQRQKRDKDKHTVIINANKIIKISNKKPITKRVLRKGHLFFIVKSCMRGYGI